MLFAPTGQAKAAGASSRQKRSVASGHPLATLSQGLPSGLLDFASSEPGALIQTFACESSFKTPAPGQSFSITTMQY